MSTLITRFDNTIWYRELFGIFVSGSPDYSKISSKIINLFHFHSESQCVRYSIPRRSILDSVWFLLTSRKITEIIVENHTWTLAKLVRKMNVRFTLFGQWKIQLTNSNGFYIECDFFLHSLQTFRKINICVRVV